MNDDSAEGSRVREAPDVPYPCGRIYEPLGVFINSIARTKLPPVRTHVNVRTRIFTEVSIETVV